MTTYRLPTEPRPTYCFTTEQRNGRVHIRRDGEPVGSVLGEATQRDAEQAIEQIKRMDRLAS